MTSLSEMESLPTDITAISEASPGVLLYRKIPDRRAAVFLTSPYRVGFLFTFENV